MGVVSWLALALAVFACPTAAGGGSALAVDTAIVHLAADADINSTLVDKVTLLAADKAAVHSLKHTPPGDACLRITQNALKNTVGFIHITTNKDCANAHRDGPLLVLVYNAAKDQFSPIPGSTSFKASDKEALLATLDNLVVRVAAANKPTKKLDSTTPLAVPLWTIIVAGILVGVLLAGNCILCSRLRARGPSPVDVKNNSKKNSSSGSSKRDSTSKRSNSKSSSVKKHKKKKASSGSSSRSGRTTASTASVKKPSSKGKKSSSKTVGISCRSSKTLSTKTCENMAPTSVKVISVGPPRSEAKPSAKDEVATAMATRTSLPERSLDRRVEMPMNEDEFMVAMKKVIQFSIEFYRNPSKWPVSSDIRPNQIFNQLPQCAPENPERFDAIWHDFHEIILRGCLHWNHPQFHAFFPCGRSYPDILAETIISSLGTVGFTWSANPAITELDTAMVNWMGRALGIPECFLFTAHDMCASDGGGLIADSASDAIFCAMMAARHTKVEQELARLGAIEEDRPMTESTRHCSKKYEKRAQIISKLVAYGSYESHSSFEKACKMACVRCRPIKVFEENEWGMRRQEAEKEMEKDRQRGLIPFYLHVALGTTSTATSDHLTELTPLKEKFDVWIHVDAAYAGSAWVVEKYRKHTESLDKVDSININLHKFFLASTSVTVFWTKRQRDYKECFRVDPAYLKKKSGATDLRDWGIQLSRRFKSLKVYMLLRTYGLNGMRAYVTRLIEMTEYMESLIVKLPNIRKFGKTNYALFCVQYAEEGWSKEQVNHATNRLCEHMNNSHKIALTHSNVRGNDILRVAICLERTTKKDIHDSVAIFTQLLEAFKKKLEDDDFFHNMAMATLSRENLMQDMDMGIVGSPNPTLSRTPTNVKSTISCESLVGPRTARSQMHSALTSATQDTTQVQQHRPSSVPASPVPVTNIEAIKTIQLSASKPLAPAPAPAPPAAAAPVALLPPAAAALLPPAANKMPPLQPAFAEDPSSKSGGGASSYNAPPSAPPSVPTAAEPAPKTAEKQPPLTAPEVTARSDTVTEKK